LAGAVEEGENDVMLLTEIDHVAIAVNDLEAAIDFYRRAFGAVEVFRVVGDDGRLGHAELQLGDVRLLLSDAYPEIGVQAPRDLGGSGVTLHLAVTDCDAVHDRAVAAGASSVRPPSDQAHGNRLATIEDPFGHRWMLSQELEAFDLETYAAREGDGFTVQAGPGADLAVREPNGPPALWPCLNCGDAPGLIRQLVDVLGFTEQLVVTDPDEPAIVHHAELRWPTGGGVMLGSAGRDDTAFTRMPVGAAALYLVTDDLETVWQRCRAAGWAVVDELHAEDYGGSVFTVRDPEGNLWSVGDYTGSGA
jgi:uncharacterized glyoxalase superfamily protein PhnB